MRLSKVCDPEPDIIWSKMNPAKLNDVSYASQFVDLLSQFLSANELYSNEVENQGVNRFIGNILAEANPQDSSKSLAVCSTLNVALARDR